MLEFFFGHINGADGRSHPCPICTARWPKRHAEDRQPLASLDFRVLQGAIDRDARTKERRSVYAR